MGEVMETPTFRTTDFEGPLDLLLALISKNKMNIYDIEIVSLITQYLEIVNATPYTNMDKESEFIEMAARLIYMKSVFLLPKAEEQEKLRDELTGILIEYSACKRVAAQFKTMSEGIVFFVRKQSEVEFDTDYTIRHDPAELKKLLDSLMGKPNKRSPPKQEQFDELVAVPFVSISSKILFLMRNLTTQKITKLKGFFSKDNTRSEVVATFLAVLELVRAGRVTIDANEDLQLNRKKHK